MARWRSRAVSLVFIGVGAAACAPAPQPEYRRNIYATQDDCYRDYSPRYCAPAAGAAGVYYGPMFWWSGGRRPRDDPGPGASAYVGGGAGPGEERAGASRLAARVTAPVAIAPGAARGGIGETGRSYGGGRRGG
jgi:hypothetical protein